MGAKISRRTPNFFESGDLVDIPLDHGNTKFCVLKEKGTTRKAKVTSNLNCILERHSTADISGK